MTDNNNLDDVEEEFSDFDDGEFDTEGEGEFAEGDEFVEEEWDSFDQDGDMMAEEPVSKKKSSLIVNLVIILVALGGAGFVGLKFLGGGSQSSQIAQQQDAATMDAAPAMSSPTEQHADGNMAQAAATQQAAGQDFTPPPSDPDLDFDMPMPFSNQSPENADMAQAPASQPANGRQSSDMSDLSTAPGAEASGGFESEPLTPLPIPGATDAAVSQSAGGNMNAFDTTGDAQYGTAPSMQNDFGTQPSMSSGSDDEVISAVESKIDQLFNRLDTIEDRLKTSTSSGGSYDDSDLKASIAKLEKKVNSLSAKISSGTVSRSVASSGAAPHTPPVSHSTRSSAGGSWILTSAQPGKATVKKAGSEDVISIAVGDRVSGLGKILSIRMVDGKWVVNTMNGQIVQ